MECSAVDNTKKRAGKKYPLAGRGEINPLADLSFAGDAIDAPLYGTFAAREEFLMIRPPCDFCPGTGTPVRNRQRTPPDRDPGAYSFTFYSLPNSALTCEPLQMKISLKRIMLRNAIVPPMRTSLKKCAPTIMRLTATMPV